MKRKGHEIEAIEFSADYGQTWFTVEVPADMDSYQWVWFTLEWQPEAAGTYCLHTRTIDAGGVEQMWPASVILIVTE